LYGKGIKTAVLEDEYSFIKENQKIFFQSAFIEKNNIIFIIYELSHDAPYLNA